MVADILQTYVAGLNAGNCDAIAELFAEKCDFIDGGARLFNFPDLIASGREGVREAFRGVFETFQVKAEIVKLNPNSMEYDVFLADLEIPCIGAATIDAEGKITEYLVRPR